MTENHLPNLVVLSFVNPQKLMNLTTDSTDTNGIPNGMNAAVVNYFESKGVRVMMSIGGISYTKDWDKALGSNPTQLGINAANAAKVQPPATQACALPTTTSKMTTATPARATPSSTMPMIA